MQLSTYTLEGLNEWNEAKFLEQKEDLNNESRYAWVYLYMGYDE